VQFPPPPLKALARVRKCLYLLNFRHLTPAQGCGYLTRGPWVTQTVYPHRNHIDNINLRCCLRNRSELRRAVIRRCPGRNSDQHPTHRRSLMGVGPTSAQLCLSSLISAYFPSSGRRSAEPPRVPRRAWASSGTIARIWSVRSWVQIPPPRLFEYQEVLRQIGRSASCLESRDFVNYRAEFKSHRT
jgi:hypothetical protein